VTANQWLSQTGVICLALLPPPATLVCHTIPYLIAASCSPWKGNGSQLMNKSQRVAGLGSLMRKHSHPGLDELAMRFFLGLPHRAHAATALHTHAAAAPHAICYGCSSAHQKQEQERRPHDTPFRAQWSQSYRPFLGQTLPENGKVCSSTSHRGHHGRRRHCSMETTDTANLAM